MWVPDQAAELPFRALRRHSLETVFFFFFWDSFGPFLKVVLAPSMLF